MNEKIVYKEFGTVKEFHRYLEGVYDTSLFTYYVNRNYYWNIVKGDYSNKYYTIRTFANINPISNSKIGCFVITEYMIYFYVGDNKVYTIITQHDTHYLRVHTKLYHLIHGPKALSIPDAFKVLSL